MPAKKKYVASGEITISVSTTVKATSVTQAKRLAAEQPMQSLCGQCGHPDYDNEWGTSGELDGEVKITSAEEDDAE